MFVYCAECVCVCVIYSVGNWYGACFYSDPNSVLGGVRLPPDTEIIKYTSSIVGPKVPGTTNRGRKKTISLDPPSVSVLPSSGGIYMERTSKRPKLSVGESLYYIFITQRNTKVTPSAIFQITEFTLGFFTYSLIKLL